MDEVKMTEYYEQFLRLFFKTNLSMGEILKELNLSRNNNYFKYCLGKIRFDYGIDGRERAHRIRMGQWK